MYVIMDNFEYKQVRRAIREAKALCEKFVGKVDRGEARSVETYQECKDLLDTIKGLGDGL